MHKITLVCSVHRENGLCNAGELLKILRAIEPETIFEEVCPSDFDSYYKTKWSLEAQAITMYREYKLPQQVPVDRYEMPENLLVEIKRDFDCVIDCVAQASQEYLELDKEHINRAYQYGFKYLNSVDCATMMARISEIEDEIISKTGDQSLIRGLERWRHAIQRRELEMIDSIYEYCRKNVFDTGVFLVGAGHKAGLVKEMEGYASTEADQISWNFAYDGQIPMTLGYIGNERVHMSNISDDRKTVIAGREVPIEDGALVTVDFLAGRGDNKDEVGLWEFWVVYGKGPYGYTARCRPGADPGERFRRMEGLRGYEDAWQVAAAAKALRPASLAEVAGWLNSHKDDACFARTARMGNQTMRVIPTPGGYRFETFDA